MRRLATTKTTSSGSALSAAPAMMGPYDSELEALHSRASATGSGNISGLFTAIRGHKKSFQALYAEHTLPIALDVHLEGETYELTPTQEAGGGGRHHHVADLGPFPLLDAVATRDESGRALAVAVVNQDCDRDLAATLDLGRATLAGPVAAWEVNGPDVTSTNSFETPRAVDVHARRLGGQGATLEHTFPAHSVTVLRLETDGAPPRA